MSAFLARVGWVVFLVAAAMILSRHDGRAAVGSSARGDGDLCATAVVRAERDHRIPARLLQAIAIAESGRHDAATGAARAWPWTVMAEGKGRYFTSQHEAVAAVRTLQGRGVRNIDVGCMQINLHHHPDAFASLAEAFDPVANTAYAGRFLSALKRETGSWEQAAGRYHSATPKFNRPYRKKIMRLWAEARKQAPRGGQRRAANPSPDAGANVTVLAGSRRPPIDHQRVAMLNANHRAAASDRRKEKGAATLSSVRSRLPLVSVGRNRSSHREPRVLRGGRARVSPSTIDQVQFESRRREQLAAWRENRRPSSLPVTVFRGNAKR